MKGNDTQRYAEFGVKIKHVLFFLTCPRVWPGTKLYETVRYSTQWHAMGARVHAAVRDYTTLHDILRDRAKPLRELYAIIRHENAMLRNDTQTVRNAHATIRKVHAIARHTTP